MYGVSFFGVTPGFTRKDYCSDEILQSIIEECSGLYTLDQFTVRLPPHGTLYIFGGRMVGAQHVTFIGLRRHAIEYKGNREGGHYGVGIWLVNSWIRPDVVGLLDEMMAFLSHQLVNAEGRVIRTFEQMDWDEAPILLQKLGKLRNDPDPMREDVFSDGMESKFLLAHEATPNTSEFSTDFLPRMVHFFKQEPVILKNRVIYTTSDQSVVQAVRDLHRVAIISYERFLEQYRFQRQASRGISNAAQPQSAVTSMDSNDHPDVSIPGYTIPVHDDYGENAKRSPMRFPAKSPGFNRSTSDVASKLLALLRENMINVVAGVLIAFLILLLTQGPDILRLMRPRIVVTPHDDLSNTAQKPPELKPGSSNATSSGSDLQQCLKAKMEASERDATQLKNIEKKIARDPSSLNGKEVQALSALIQREREYIKCLEPQ